MPLPAILTRNAQPMGALAPPAAMPEATAAAPAGGSLADESASFPLAMQQQLQTNWCWSAVATSVSLFYNATSGWTQCELVNQELGLTTCCQDGTTSACNVPWFLDRALTRTGNLFSVTSGVVSFDTVMQLVAAAAPLGVRIGWAGGGGHFVVLRGYAIVDGTTYVDVEDPWYGYSTYTYQLFLSAYQSTGSWTHSYRTNA